MSAISVGDLSRSFQLRNDTARLRGDMQRLTEELSSGRRADLRTAVAGDFGALGVIERSLTTLSAYRLAADETALILDAGQRALEQVQTNSTALAPTLMLIQRGTGPEQIDAAGQDARSRFAAVVTALNARVADRTILAGAATGGPALAGSEAMLDELTVAVAGALTADDVRTAVDAWFDPGGGFETSGYLGSAVPLSPIEVAEGDAIQLTLRADDPAIRETLTGFALAALLDRGVLTGQNGERGALARMAGETLLSADAAFTAPRAEIGTLQERVDTARARTLADTGAMEIAKSEIVAVDPFRAAAELQTVEAQLETLYTLTARLSRLSLTEFLR